MLEQVKVEAPQHNFTGPSDNQSEFDPADSVGLIWCPRTGSEAARLITDSVTEGLPTVALLQDATIPAVDYSTGNIEVAFSPFNAVEVAQRVELVLARAHGPAERNVISHGELVIDQDRYEVRLAGRKVDLTYKEYELLKYIAARPGRVFSREALLRAVWDYDYFGGTRTVDVHVRRLRSKINDVRYQFIETVWNVGYRFRQSGGKTSEQAAAADGD